MPLKKKEKLEKARGSYDGENKERGRSIETSKKSDRVSMREISMQRQRTGSELSARMIIKWKLIMLPFSKSSIGLGVISCSLSSNSCKVTCSHKWVGDKAILSHCHLFLIMFERILKNCFFC